MKECSQAKGGSLLKLKESEEVADVSPPSSGSVRLFSFASFLACHDVNGLIVDVHVRLDEKVEGDHDTLRVGQLICVM